MPELRRDPITHRWSIIATERALRPKAFVQESRQKPPEPAVCPFCAGQEHLTPAEIHRVESPDGGWCVRVVPNKYPALRIEGELDKRPEGIFDHMNGIGAHEVIVESPEHDYTLQGLPHDHLVDVLVTYQKRMVDLAGDPRFKFSLLFRNEGQAAGATIPHGHAQLIALPVVPFEVQTLLDGAKRYYDFRDRNVFEDIVRQEVEDGRRLIADNRDFVLVAPYASRFPFEMCIIPREGGSNGSRFEDVSREGLASLADILTTALTRLDRALGTPAYNFVIQSAPYEMGELPWYRWHLQIIPKLTRVAGFESGTGFYINPTAPEEAAEFLRNTRD